MSEKKKPAAKKAAEKKPAEAKTQEVYVNVRQIFIGEKGQTQRFRRGDKVVIPAGKLPKWAISIEEAEKEGKFKQERNEPRTLSEIQKGRRGRAFEQE